MTVATIAHRPTGIASIGLHLPPLATAVDALAGAWEGDVRRDLDSRTRIGRAEHETLRS